MADPVQMGFSGGGFIPGESFAPPAMKATHPESWNPTRNVDTPTFTPAGQPASSALDTGAGPGSFNPGSPALFGTRSGGSGGSQSGGGASGDTAQATTVNVTTGQSSAQNVAIQSVPIIILAIALIAVAIILRKR